MLRYIISLILLTGTISAFAQRECPSRPPSRFIIRDSASMAQRAQQYRTLATLPLIMKIWVVAFSDDDGSNQSVADDTIMMRIGNMSNYYSSHDICFVLGGIEHVKSSDLNVQAFDSEEDELEPYLRDGFITVFVHRSLRDENLKYWGGWAYDIPNTYLSVDGDRIANLPDLLAHEMGHCFGLYHTFETAHGTESVARNGSCRDCDTEGDLLCDTQADMDTDEMFINPSTCEYTGHFTDECNVIYKMAPTNIMTYGRASCRDHFTTAQGGRCRDFIMDQLGDLFDKIAADYRDVTNLITYSSGYISAVARYQVSFQSLSFGIEGSAKLFSSARQLDVKPGTTFSPGSTGYAHLKPNTFCQ